MDLPAPVHGMSNVNRAIYHEIKCTSLRMAVINTAPSYFSKLFGTRYWGVIKLIHTIICFVRLIAKLLFLDCKVAYRPINGGLGQVYDLVYLIILRAFGQQVIIHHHSYNYMNSKSTLFVLLNIIAGRSARHIVLGTNMGSILSSLYEISNSQITVVSNIVFFDTVKKNIPIIEVNRSTLVLGHLGNLCLAKGVDDFLLLCYELKLRRVDFEAKVAGPIANAEVEEIIFNACAELDEIEYLGALYGDAKDRFFSSLDVFVFPSKYKNEAEPLVLYEAGMHGVLNIGTRRGCMKSVIDQLGGVSVEEGSEVVTHLADALEQQIQTNGFEHAARAKRLEAFVLARKKARIVLEQVLTEMRA